MTCIFKKTQITLPFVAPGKIKGKVKGEGRLFLIHIHRCTILSPNISLTLHCFLHKSNSFNITLFTFISPLLFSFTTIPFAIEIPSFTLFRSGSKGNPSEDGVLGSLTVTVFGPSRTPPVVMVYDFWVSLAHHRLLSGVWVTVFRVS